MRLGRRQIDVLRAAEAGRSWTRHEGRGRFSVRGLTDSYGFDVLERLLELDLIRLEDDGRMVAGYRVVLTEAGVAALADAVGEK